MTSTAIEQLEYTLGKLLTNMDPQSDHAAWELTRTLQDSARALREDIARIEKRIDMLESDMKKKD